MKKILCLKETRPDCGNQFCVWRLDKGRFLDDIFDGIEAGDKVNFECVEMTEDELNALPEFEGW